MKSFSNHTSVERTKQARELGFQRGEKGKYWKGFGGMGIIKACSTVFLLFFLGRAGPIHMQAQSAPKVENCGAEE